MAASLTVNANLTLSDTGVNVTSNPGTVSYTPTSSLNEQGVFTVPTTAGGVVIPLGGVTTPGYVQITNLDGTNYVTILTAVSGTAFARIKPSQTMLVFLDPTLTAPAWVAHTGACKVNFCVTDGA